MVNFGYILVDFRTILNDLFHLHYFGQAPRVWAHRFNIRWAQGLCIAFHSILDRMGEDSQKWTFQIIMQQFSISFSVVSVVNVGKIRVNPHTSFLKCPPPLHSTLGWSCLTSVSGLLFHILFVRMTCACRIVFRRLVHRLLYLQYRRLWLVLSRQMPLHIETSFHGNFKKKSKNFEVGITFFLDIWSSYSF